MAHEKVSTSRTAYRTSRRPSSYRRILGRQLSPEGDEQVVQPFIVTAGSERGGWRARRLSPRSRRSPACQGELSPVVHGKPA
jgi:hypothetical protein